MKKKILLPVMIFLLFGAKTYAQNPCAPNVGISFSNVTQSGGTFTVWTPNGACTYAIPPCGNPGETICLDGSGIYGDCQAVTPADIQGWGGIQISVVNYAGNIHNEYNVSYDGTNWSIVSSSNGFVQSTFTNLGLTSNDLALLGNPNGTLGFALNYPDNYDDQGNFMTL